MDLYYSLSVRMNSDAEPENYWTFEHATFSGGPVYEIYPAMGMKVNGCTYGLLTDNGFRNKWTRVSRQTDGHGFLIGLEKQPDYELMTISTKEEQKQGKHRVQYQFGEYLDFSNHDYEKIQLSEDLVWAPIHGEANLSFEDGIMKVEGSNGPEKGVHCPVVLDKNELYEIYFEYRSEHPLSLRLFGCQ